MDQDIMVILSIVEYSSGTAWILSPRPNFQMDYMLDKFSSDSWTALAATGIRLQAIEQDGV